MVPGIPSDVPEITGVESFVVAAVSPPKIVTVAEVSTTSSLVVGSVAVAEGDARVTVASTSYVPLPNVPAVKDQVVAVTEGE